MTLSYLLQYYHLNQPEQIMFVCSLAVNTACMPFFMIKSRKKISQILNPAINKSYSKISIKIMRVLHDNAILVITNTIMFVAQEIYFQFKYESYENFENNSKNVDVKVILGLFMGSVQSIYVVTYILMIF